MLVLTLTVAAVVSLSQIANAGWSGAMNGTGYGWASVQVTSSTGHSNSVQTANMTDPSAAMKTTAGYTAGAALPAGASAATVARIKGAAGYIWTADTSGANGDSTDNPSIDLITNIAPAECPSVNVETSTMMSSDGQSGVVVVTAQATEGTAILFRGYEYMCPTPPQSIADLETCPNSVLKFQTLIAGPFGLNPTNCNTGNGCDTVVIPFTIQTSDTNLYFVSDGEAKSTPLQLFCPNNIVVNCGEPVVYQPASYTGCGDFTVTFDPPQSYAFPVGVTPVTVTISNQYGDTASCTFTVTVLGNFSGFAPPINGVGGTCASPRCVNTCGSTIPIKFDLSCGSKCVTPGPAPVIEIIPYSKTCTAGAPILTADAVFAGDWTYNWNTKGYAKGVYEIIANLPDGTSQFVYIKLQ